MNAVVLLQISLAVSLFIVSLIPQISHFALYYLACFVYFDCKEHIPSFCLCSCAVYFVTVILINKYSGNRSVQDSQCTYNVTLRCLCLTIVALEQQ